MHEKLPIDKCKIPPESKKKPDGRRVKHSAEMFVTSENSNAWKMHPTDAFSEMI